MSTNTEVLTAVHGIAPRSDELHRLGSAAEKGRASWDEFAALRDQETADWFAAQEAAGIDIQEDGKLAWQDHLRPLVKASEGFAPDVDDAPVTRWFDTNRFYRRPTVIEQPRFNIDRFVELYGEPGTNISLPTPGSFATLCDGAEVNWLSYYDSLFSGLIERGVGRITLEAYLDNDRTDIISAWHLGSEFCDTSLAVLSHASVRCVPHELLTSGWGLTDDQVRHISAEPYTPIVDGKPIYFDDGELYSIPPPDFREQELWLPCVPADETGELTSSTDTALLTISKFRPAKLVLTHTTDLEQVPLPHAVSKLHQLGELAQTVREQLEGQS